MAEAVPAERSGRASWILSQLYYYVASVAGVGLLLGGAIGALLGLRDVLLPGPFQTARDGVRDLLRGVAFALPGGLALLWHLRQARSREGATAPPGFWGRSLYYHLVALLALAFVLGGTVALLNSGVDAAVPQCYEQPVAEPLPAEPPAVEPDPAAGAAPGTHGESVQRECHPTPGEAGRRAVGALIILVVAAPVWLWHLREGRRATAPVPASSPPPAP